MHYKNVKKLGLIGGTTWQSTVIYYTRLNELIAQRLGGSHSCECVLYSMDFAPIEANVKNDDKKAIERILVNAAQCLKAAGAEALVLCANSPHLFVDQIESRGLRVIHIGEATANAVAGAGLNCVGLLGTRYTMELDFIRGRVERRGIKVITPSETDRVYIQHTILDEFARGVYNEAQRVEYRRIIRELKDRGAEGIILGCTEIPILLRNEKLELPAFDTTEIHVQAAAEFSARV